MKRPWVTYLLSAGFVGLLVLLAVLQVRWMAQINEAENEKAHKRLKEQADMFATDFNREIQSAYFNFQTEPEAWKNRDWVAFNERYDYWQEKTAYPDLIAGFYFLEAKGEGAPLVYDRDQRAFVTGDVPAELTELRGRLTDEKSFKAVHDDLYMLVMPIHEPGRKMEDVVLKREPDSIPPRLPMPPTYGYLAIKLNAATITEQIVPALTAKYFGDSEFRVGIDRKNGPPVVASIDASTADATAKLFDMSPDNFIFFANKELMSTIGERHESVVLNSKIEGRTFDVGTPDAGKTVKIEVQSGAKPRTQVFTAATSSDSPWVLAVQHASGSLDIAAASTLRRNLAVGLGLLLLLGLAVAMIFISALRAKLFAQRQIDFVSSVTHEFRTPLAVIYSAGENLADGVAKSDRQVLRYGELIKGEGRKLTGMIEQILDFAGANSGRRRFTFTDTSVDEVIRNAVDECRPLIENKNFDVQVDIAESLPPMHADKAALSQVVQNLLANSIKYSNGSSWARVSAENGDGRIRIIVEDRGLGISKKDLRQIFAPFYRSKSVVDAQIHGNGLGLSLVRQIVDAHKGKISVESEPGKGSKFTIELPQP
jgi:signal transduction histidine kinase